MNQRQVSIDKRIEIWMNEFPNHIYEKIDTPSFQVYFTKDMISYKEVLSMEFHDINIGDTWGQKWEYGWFRTRIKVSDWAVGKTLYFLPAVGGEMLVYVNGIEVGASDLQHDGIVLTRNAKLDDIYTIYMESYAGHGPRLEHGGPIPYGQIAVAEAAYHQCRVGASSVGIWHEDIYEIYMDAYTLYRLYQSLEDGSLRKEKIKVALMEMTKYIDYEVERDSRFQVVEIKELLTPLLDCKNGSTAPEMTIFGQSHLDLAWKWHLDETRRKCARTLSNQLTLLDEYEDYIFLLCEPYISYSLSNDYKELYDKVKKRVEEGRIIVEGGMWVEPDTNIPNGESLIRQCIYGRRWFQDEHNYHSKMVWLPDCFGFSGQLPQIMIKSGLKYFATQKLFRPLKGHDPFPYNNFYWQGIDGTKILTHFFKKNNSRYDPYHLNERWNKDRVQKENIDSMLFPFGYGDGGGGPTRDMLELVKRTKDLEGAPRTRMESPIRFFERLEKSKIYNTYVGEIYLPWHRGTYTAESAIKKGNRKSEVALRNADMLFAMKELMFKLSPMWKEMIIESEKRKAELHELWKLLLLNQFHDIIAGTCITRVHEEAKRDFLTIIESANQMINETLNEMEKEYGKVDKHKRTLMIMNTLSWERECVIPLENDFYPMLDTGESLIIQEGNGRRYTSVLLPSMSNINIYHNDSYENELLKQIISEPVLRAKCNVIPCHDNQHTNNNLRNHYHLENDCVIAIINQYGELISFYEKDSQTEYIKEYANQFRLYQDVNVEYDAWELAPYYKDFEINIRSEVEIELLSSGELFTQIKVKKYLNQSYMEQIITLYAGRKQLEFKTLIDWKEQHKLLKVDFPVNIHCEEAIEDIQFGYVKRPTHASKNHHGDQYEVCNHKYTALTTSNRSIALLNDCKYGVSTTGDSIELSLLRAPKIPDMYSDQGRHEFTYIFMVDHCNFHDGNIIEFSYELNHPPILVNNISLQLPSIHVDKKEVIVETVKLAEDDSKDIIIRIYESRNSYSQANISLHIPYLDSLPECMAYEVMMYEEIDGYSKELKVLNQNDNIIIGVNLSPYEIMTIRVIFKK